ncbi:MULTISPECIES: hypothetical protein [unclassified Chryseobacterium]|nr:MULTISPECIES: hypothetical protein [unclassified Chryseobacterium]
MMDAFKKLETYCKNIAEISDDEWEEFISKFEVVRFKKDEHYLQI